MSWFPIVWNNHNFCIITRVIIYTVIKIIRLKYFKKVGSSMYAQPFLHTELRKVIMC